MEHIPKADGEQRTLGIPTVRDRVEAAAKLILEPIFEVGFKDCWLRPKRLTTQTLERIRAGFVTCSMRTFRDFFGNIVCLVVLAGCPGEQECGVGSNPATGIKASGVDFTMTFDNVTSSENNDCPVAGTPQGVISLTLDGVQTDGTGIFTMCFQRPDRINGDSALGPDLPGEDIPARLVTLLGESNGCTFDLIDPFTEPSPKGTATGTGACANGTDPAGFTLALDGEATLTRTCGASVEFVTATLSGNIAIMPR
jgi:hypothetical protein